MTASERIDFLVGMLEGNNGKAFAQKTGIIESVLSHIRNGKGKERPKSYYPRILAAYPQVNSDWLVAGIGKPFHDQPATISEKLNAVLERLDRIEELLSKMA